ncbi:hypothetical protein IP81_06775 [Novosphingobium sp. AAP83]|uniref:acyltransferase family protein n=1 Tax=Novosphingobium sp. AAP83 TaxID=1523425 RepID=UPI0006CDA02B|nr:acyltransferase family protein [Novosphingobium sp. AAP83]KPF92358.1 hypothetical protein IP81_06775 [Novosphingobium sp. AAP83]
MIYRKEIDGLRAVAVVPVILFHAGLTVFSGGYVGVDVFFVISGYLITSILINELEQGNFSISRFYERRARRILPALFFVVACCIPFAWMWMLPGELKDFSRSIVAVVFFASNILFWREEGYFSPAAELKPLLHTWSLAVEEQYYLLFPVFLLLAWRFGRNRVVWSICLIAAISLAVSEWAWRNQPTANFYLAPTRAWELLAGSMSAFWLSGREPRANNWLSLSGLALIVFAIFYYDDATPFPSLYALAPVLGTALIIVFGRTGTWTAKLLGMRGFVGIGLISYSAYLWHQPLFAFARIRSIVEPEKLLMLALTALSLLLAYLSWRYVEQPFRNGRASVLPTRRAVFAASALVAAVFVTGGLTGDFRKGFPQRFSRLDIKGDVGHTYYHRYIDDTFFDCSPKEIANKALIWEEFLRCKQSKSDTPIIALVGDSHAEHLFVGLSNNVDDNVVFYIKSSVPTLKNVEFSDIFQYILNENDVKIVIFSVYYERINDIYDIPQFKNNMISTIRTLQSSQKQVFFVKDVPSFRIDPESCILSKTTQIAYERCKFDKNQFLQKTKRYNEILNDIKMETNIAVYDPINDICDKKFCSMIKGNRIIYRDGNHLNLIGSEMIGKNLSQFIKRFREN